MSGISPGRAVAVEVLHRVATDDAWAMPSLDAEIRRGGLDRRDAALATEIVYGTLRVLPSLDALLARFLRQPDKTEAYLRATLRAAAYQLMHLDRAPAHAVVSDAVSIIKRGRSPKLAGVANAVLRKVAKARPEAPARPTRIELPAWLETRLQQALGPRTGAFLEGVGWPPPMGLRLVGDGAGVLDAIRAACPEATVTAVGETSALLRNAGDPRALPGYAEGRFAVQELGAQAVTRWAEVAPGERVADLCCGHGTKTLAFAEQVGEGGHVEAVDLHEAKLDALSTERARLGIPPSRVGTRAVDLTVGLGGHDEGSFDRVILDAPCTGLGTVHRRPELALRITKKDPGRLGRLQRALLDSAVRLVRPEGTLVYIVCSPTREEGEAVVAGFTESNPGVTLLDRVEVGPWEGERDAYVAARWRIR
ncbi:MAG: transcription antitermination factor NusB [Sandaracinaceae bacterium]